MWTGAVVKEPFCEWHGVGQGWEGAASKWWTQHLQFTAMSAEGTNGPSSGEDGVCPFSKDKNSPLVSDTLKPDSFSQ